MKLSIVLVSYNTKKYLKNCLNSLYRQFTSRDPGVINPGVEIIVCDNASTDSSANMVKKDFPKVKLILNKKNLGFAKANNIGIKQSSGDYIMLLNADTLIHDQNVLNKLINYMDQHQDVGAITPKLVLPDGAIDLACHRGFPTPWNAFCYFTKLERIFPNLKLFSGYHQTWRDFNLTHEVDVIAGAAMVVRQEVINEVGMLDERFLMYAEDIDWCKRIKDAGWKIVYFPQVEITHLKSQAGKAKKKTSIEHQFATKNFYFTMKQFYQKHYSQKYPDWLERLTYFGIDFIEKITRQFN